MQFNAFKTKTLCTILAELITLHQTSISNWFVQLFKEPFKMQFLQKRFFLTQRVRQKAYSLFITKWSFLRTASPYSYQVIIPICTMTSSSGFESHILYIMEVFVPCLWVAFVFPYIFIFVCKCICIIDSKYAIDK